jgi:hypothetical protein
MPAVQRLGLRQHRARKRLPGGDFSVSLSWPPIAGRAANRNRIMKVTVEVDCTPEEARRFLGLPDVVPMQQAIMETLQQRMQSAIDATTPEALLKAWMPMAPDQMQQAFAKLFGAFGGSKPGDTG